MPIWNLADLYPSPKSKALHADLKKAADEALAIKQRFLGKLAEPASDGTRLAEAINRFLEPIRERRAHYVAHPLLLQDVLAQGIRRMQAEAHETMRQVRDVSGLSYSQELYADTVDLFGTE